MGTTFLEETSGRVRVAPLTVEQYEAMADKGIIPSGTPIELIDGMLVYKDRSARGTDPMTIGGDHAKAVKLLARLGSKFEALGCHLATQMPIRIRPKHEPEPDGSVVMGRVEQYDEHPDARFVHAVVEVSDSSLATDLSTKLRVYAAAGIEQYIVVNLVDSRVEIFTDPVPKDGRYRKHERRTGAKVVAIRAGGKRAVKVKAKDLLP